MGYFNAYAKAMGTNWDCLRQAGHMVTPVFMGAPTITMGTPGSAPSSLPGDSIYLEVGHSISSSLESYVVSIWYKAVTA